MGADPSQDGGLLTTLRRLVHTAVASVHNRLELFTVELEEQKQRAVRVLALAIAALLLGNIAVLMISATIVVVVGDDARVPVLIGLSVLYVLATVWAFLALRRELQASSPAFQDTLSEIRKDSDWLKGDH